mmetsp:Transcript_133523/g.249693  ORF Transcript_133523/g.249693 Transcript_133523/m.249693 type:complete len:459 (+) Transcript_133523:55-1431(+)
MPANNTFHSQFPTVEMQKVQGIVSLKEPECCQPKTDSYSCAFDSHDFQELELASLRTCDVTDDEKGSSDAASFCSEEQNFSGETPEQQDLLQLLGNILSSGPALAQFVVHAMARHGWGNVDHSQVVVQECSGFEGRTFKVSTESINAVPSVVAFHVLNNQVAADDICKGRMAAAQTVFAANRISAARIAQGDNWFVEPWIGTKVGGVYDLNRPKHRKSTAESFELTLGLHTESPATASPAELGELLARIHAIPTGWYDEWRVSICARRPALLSAESGSHIWPFTARQQIFEKLSDESIRLWCQAGPKAASSAGARIVTTHGDFHPANIIRGQDGLQVIDFGLTCVTSAAKDLSWACEYFLHGIEEKRAFASAYLKAGGLPAENDEVDALLLDAECFALHSFTGVLLGQLDNLREDPVRGLDDYFAFAAIAEDALTNTQLRSEILEKGLFFSSPYQALW